MAVCCSGVRRRQLCKNIEKLFVAQEIVSLRRRKGHTEVLPNENKCFGIYVGGAIYININVCVCVCVCLGTPATVNIIDATNIVFTRPSDNGWSKGVADGW